MPARLLRRAGALAAILPLIAAFATQAALDPPLTLDLDNRFPPPGGSMTFTVTGPAGANVQIKASPGVGRLDLPAWGTIFLDLSKVATVGSAVLSQTGEATVVVPVPDIAERLDQLLYFQAAGRLDSSQGVSNAVSIRLSEAPPSGPRRPGALVVDPGGQKAWVAHEDDGTLSVVDLVTGTKTSDLPVAVPDTAPVRGVALEIDPDGRNLFLVDPRRREVVVTDAASDSVAARIPVAAGTRDIAFDFGAERRIYLTNERNHEVSVLVEEPIGVFTVADVLSLEGRGPGPVTVDGDGRILVGQWMTHEVEVVDPSVAGGLSVAHIALGALPHEIVVVGDRAFVTTFRPGDGVPSDQGGTGDGNNVVVEIDLVGATVVADHLTDLGTDFGAAATDGSLLAFVAQGSGTLIVADTADLSLLDSLNVAPGEPTTHLVAVELTTDEGGAAVSALALQRFRESLRVVDLSVGPPYVQGAEIPLAWSGQPRVPGLDLEPLEMGQWLFSTVEFFNGRPATPNRVTCETCHPSSFSTGLNHPATSKGKQAQVLFDTGSTGPWLHKGNVPDLVTKTAILFNAHGTVGGELDPGHAQSMTDLQATGFGVPSSPFLDASGAMSAAAEAGKLVFEGDAGCAVCHTAPLFIPEAPEPLTIEAGVGTGLVPANVPSLRGLWASAPYLWNGAAPTLMDVLTTSNPADLHGTTSTLTQQQLEDLVAYLESL